MYALPLAAKLRATPTHALWQVLPGLRGQGYGRVLLELTAALARDFNAEAIDFCVPAADESGEDAVSFLKHFGGVVESGESAYLEFSWDIDS